MSTKTRGLRRPDLLLGKLSPARALRTLASRRHVWECQEAKSVVCVRCYKRCVSRPCVLLPAEAAAMMKAGLGDYIALQVVSVQGIGRPTVDVLYVAPIGHEGGRVPLGKRELPCIMLCPRQDGRSEACALPKRPVASVIRACGNWKSRSGSGKYVKGYAAKLAEAETLYYGLAVLLWSRKYGKYVSALWKETVLYGG